MKLKEVMNSPVLTIDSDEAVHKAAHIMSMSNIGSLIVTQSGKPVGIITERDILKKVVATCRDVRHVKASDIMSKSLKTADQNMDLVNAANLMIKNEIKRLPVIEDGKLVGMVTFTDLLRVYPDITKSFEIDVEKLPKKYKKWLRR
jgi:CBS domain-containing protein